jgi:hypothetical protein
VLVSLLLATLVSAAPPALSADAPLELKVSRRVLAAGLALVPGVVIPGLGHRIEGDHRTANKLTWISGSGLTAVLAGVAMLQTTTTSGKLSPIFLPLIFTGGSTLLSSWVADIVGAARPGGQPDPFCAEKSLSAALLYGAAFQTGSSVHQLGLVRAAYEGDQLLADGWLSLEPETRYRELHLRGGLKILGDKKRSHLALVAEFMNELGAESDATSLGGALMVEGRLDAGLIAPGLRGLMFLQRLGGGALQTSYPNTRAKDSQAMIIFETGIALALLDGLEASMLYTQRGDERVGFVTDHGGAFALEARYQILQHLRVVLLAHVGQNGDVLAGVETAW